MDIQGRLGLLTALLQLYENFIGDLEVACRKKCATCCTCNVTMTTLEGLLIITRLTEDQQIQLFEAIQISTPQPHFQPSISVNQMAQKCVQGLDIPEDIADPAMGACPLLELDTCPIYSARPFACRSMLSTEVCRPQGTAQVSSFVLTVNQVFLQYLEAIDIPGYSGNLIDVLAFLNKPPNKKSYREGQIHAPRPGLALNMSIPVLMIPPEHRERIAPLLQKTQLAIQQARHDEAVAKPDSNRHYNS